MSSRHSSTIESVHYLYHCCNMEVTPDILCVLAQWARPHSECVTHTTKQLCVHKPSAMAVETPVFACVVSSQPDNKTCLYARVLLHPRLSIAHKLQAVLWMANRGSWIKILMKKNLWKLPNYTSREVGETKNKIAIIYDRSLTPFSMEC